MACAYPEKMIILRGLERQFSPWCRIQVSESAACIGAEGSRMILSILGKYQAWSTQGKHCSNSSKQVVRASQGVDSVSLLRYLQSRLYFKRLWRSNQETQMRLCISTKEAEEGCFIRTLCHCCTLLLFRSNCCLMWFMPEGMKRGTSCLACWAW